MSFEIAKLALLLAVVGWAFFPELSSMVDTWERDPMYSHGYLVPIFAAYFLWARRAQFPREPMQPSWWGVLYLAVGLAIQISGGIYGREFLEQAALLPTLFGGVLLLFGSRVTFWALPSIAFLIFMIPLPHTLANAMRQPLLTAATQSSTYLMQTLGMPALAMGNVIHVDKVEIGVVDACSGLRMLMTFIALSVAYAMLLQRPWWEKGIIVASSLPISIISNVLRITLTGALFHLESRQGWDLGRWAHRFSHDLGGWLMMPIALAQLMLVLWLLKNLFLEEPELDDVPIAGLTVPAASAAAPAKAGSSTAPPAGAASAANVVRSGK